MIKKIQKYLLIHHPVIWNIKLIPMLIILLGIHLIFFGVGYIASDASFNQTYSYYSPYGNLGILYFVCILVGIIALTGWLVFYSRNNGLKSLYPRKTRQVYLEWLLILVITSGMTLIPFTLSQGYASKWKSLASKKETQKALEILNQVKVLIPNEENSSFTYKSSYHRPIPIPREMSLRADSINLDGYAIQYSGNGELIIKGYTGASLLFFSPYGYHTYHQYKNDPEYILKEHQVDTSYWATIRMQENIKEWLQAGDKEKILAVMRDFEYLQKKHNLPVNITPEQWLDRIYKPPFFPVNYSTRIDIHQPYHFYNNSDYYDNDYYNTIAVEESSEIAITETETTEYDTYIQHSKPIPFLQYEELSQGYNQISNCYENNDEIKWLLIFCICSALWISLFIFSFRITSGKSWLIALVSTGVLLFTVMLTMIAILDSMNWGWGDERFIVIFVLLFWVVLFVGLAIRMESKIRRKKEKGNSKHYMNIFLWLIPCQIPLLFFATILYMEMSHNDYNIVEEETIINMFWMNTMIVIVAMWGVSAFVRRWKSIADE